MEEQSEHRACQEQFASRTLTLREYGSKVVQMTPVSRRLR